MVIEHVFFHLQHVFPNTCPLLLTHRRPRVKQRLLIHTGLQMRVEELACPDQRHQSAVRVNEPQTQAKHKGLITLTPFLKLLLAFLFTVDLGVPFG